MDVFYREGYTDIEMEAGPYLSAIYENVYPKRYPLNEIVNLFLNLTYDVGILHYASDTPYSRRQALLSKSLLYFGMDSTYAAAVAIVPVMESMSRITTGQWTLPLAFISGLAGIAFVLALVIREPAAGAKEKGCPSLSER